MGLRYLHNHGRRLPPGALDFSASGHLYATHPLHAFAARCPPPLVRWAIETFSEPGDVVLDPMCGSGTTLVEASLAGRCGWGADIDPLARLIATAKATLVPAKTVRSLAETIDKYATRTRDDGWRPDLARLDYWFRPEVSADLARLRRLITKAAPSGPLQRLAWTVFSSLIVGRTSVANARDLVHSRHHHRPWAQDPGTLERYCRALARAADLMADYRALLPRQHKPAAIIADDARSTGLADRTSDLVFFSPPYVAALDYPRAHSFAVAWLSDVLGMTPGEYRLHARGYIGTDRAALAEATVAQPLPGSTGHDAVDAVVEALSTDPERAWVVHRYFVDMASVFAEASRVTRAGGHVVVVVCPSNIRRVHVPTHEIFHDLAPAASRRQLRLEAHYRRTIHDGRRVMPYLETKFGERMREEYVLVFRRLDRGPGTGLSRSYVGGRGPDLRRRAAAAPSRRS